MVTYLSSRRTRLQYQIVSDYLSKSDPSFVSMPSVDQQETIKDKLQDEEFLKAHVDPEIQANFDNKKLYEAIGYLEQKKCLDTEVDPLTSSELKKVDDWKDKLLDEDKGNTTLDRIKERTPEGAILDKDSTSEFSDILDGFDQRLNNT